MRRLLHSLLVIALIVPLYGASCRERANLPPQGKVAAYAGDLIASGRVVQQFIRDTEPLTPVNGRDLVTQDEAAKAAIIFDKVGERAQQLSTLLTNYDVAHDALTRANLAGGITALLNEIDVLLVSVTGGFSADDTRIRIVKLVQDVLSVIAKIRGGLVGMPTAPPPVLPPVTLLPITP